MVKFECSVLKPADPQWGQMLSRCHHDIYHLPVYAEIVAAEQGGSAAALYISTDDSELLVPLVISGLPLELDSSQSLRDAVSPYGYGSPIWLSSNEEFLGEIPDLIRLAAGRCKLVSVFLRFHPFLSKQLYFNPVCRCLGPIVVIDLAPNPTELEVAIKLVHRRALRKLAQAGFIARASSGAEVAPESLATFIALYEQTMSRVGATRSYFFSKKYFVDLFERLGDKIGLLEVLAPEGEVICSLIFFCYAGWAHYHLSGTEDRYLKYSPLKLALKELIFISREQGAQYLNLGGGVGSKRDSLFKFKSGFGTMEEQFYVAGLVASPEYERLSTQARLMSSSKFIDGYFPLYRACL